MRERYKRPVPRAWHARLFPAQDFPASEKMLIAGIGISGAICEKGICVIMETFTMSPGSGDGDREGKL